MNTDKIRTWVQNFNNRPKVPYTGRICDLFGPHSLDSHQAIEDYLKANPAMGRLEVECSQGIVYMSAPVRVNLHSNVTTETWYWMTHPDLMVYGATCMQRDLEVAVHKGDIDMVIQLLSRC